MSRAVLGLGVAALWCARTAYAAPEAEPPPPVDHPLVLAIGPVELVGEGLGAVAARVATAEEVTHKLAVASDPGVVVVPHPWFLRAAAARPGCPPPTQWAPAREAAKLLSYDRLALVRVTFRDGSLICEWQIYDAAGDAGTLAAGRVPGHIDDLDGLMASLARRVGDAVGAFDRSQLSMSVHTGVSTSGDALGDYYYGRAAVELGDLREAETRFARALAVDPALADASLFLGAVSAARAQADSERHDWPAALQDAAVGLHALQGLPPSVFRCTLLGARAESLAQLEQPSDAAGAALEHARALVDAGFPEQAIRLIDPTAQGLPDPSQAGLLRAVALRDMSQWSDAEHELAQVAKNPAGAARARLELAWLYADWADSQPPAEQRKRYTLAKAALDRGAEAAGDWRQTRLLEGLVYLGLGDARRAADALVRAGRPDTDHPAALSPSDEVLRLSALGQARVQRGDRDVAKAALQEAYGRARAIRADLVLDHSMVRVTPYRGLTRMVRAWLDLGELALARRCLLEIRVEYGESDELSQLFTLAQTK